jgi:hypothetical protein
MQLLLVRIAGLPNQNKCLQTLESFIINAPVVA